MRIRKIKGFTEAKKADHSKERIAEQSEKISKLRKENGALKEQLEKCKALEREAKGVRKRWFELEAKKLLLRKRIEFFTREEDKTSSTTPVKGREERKDEMEFERLAQISDDEEFENVEDEGVRKAFKENREKMQALKKEIRLFFARSNPSIADIRSKVHRKSKEGKYDYAEEVN
eukprot:TRINITY_DN2690_c0_g1_i11.p3 TRINITY_DN2690_c0_g1~~TRINITY_DN2690_c0_g1_i11.p3  ORF type:complete len:175 (+),score=79.55 TRINITY_DN2690_c0_g1_i11:971-1495(+)